MKHHFFSLLAICSLLLPSCLPPRTIPITSERAANNNTYVVQYLFEHDGCKVYRFFDNGNTVYFTSCNGETTKMIHDSTGTQYIKSVNRKQ